MNQITMTDITMNQNTRRAEFSLSFREKIELAKLLDRLGVDAILTTPITENRSDSLLIKSISSAVKESAVAVPVGLEPAKVDLALKALTEAVHPRLVAEAPVSAVQMEYLAGKKPAALLAAIEDTVSKASALCQDVEFVAVDATRADMAFLKDALTTAIRSGAGIITLVDTAGDMLPEEFAAFINRMCLTSGMSGWAWTAPTSCPWQTPMRWRPSPALASRRLRLRPTPSIPSAWSTSPF